MLIGFVGCPSSGKTTTAAMTFADLKNMSVSSEFVCEQARIYIAERRVMQDLPAGAPITLTDDDQANILIRQMTHERIMVDASGPGTVVVTDTAALCTWLYMSPEFRERFGRRLRCHASKYDLLFYCAPVTMPASSDPNRIHNQEQSLKLDAMIPDLLKEFDLKAVGLTGDSKERHHTVTRTILERLVG